MGTIWVDPDPDDKSGFNGGTEVVRDDWFQYYIW